QSSLLNSRCLNATWLARVCLRRLNLPVLQSLTIGVAIELFVTGPLAGIGTVSLPDARPTPVTQPHPQPRHSILGGFEKMDLARDEIVFARGAQRCRATGGHRR